MPSITIDGQTVEFDEGQTIMDAARNLGLEIPQICFMNGQPPSATCLVCLVRLEGAPRMVPSCATEAVAGWVVESETPEVHAARKTTVELLMSEHTGDCLAPCTTGCPATMNIPKMIRQIEQNDLRGAALTVLEHLALPLTLSYVCKAPCESACRRRKADQPLGIQLLYRRCCEDLLFSEGFIPSLGPLRKERVAVVGAGAAGLSAAHYLARCGFGVTVIEAHDQPGGKLRSETTEESLPRRVLNGEINVIRRMGAQIQTGVRIGTDVSLDELRAEHDAVFIATGGNLEGLEDLPVKAGRLVVNRGTLETPIEGVFAGGTLLRPGGHMSVRSAGDGRAVTESIKQYLEGVPVRGFPRPYSSHLGKLLENEIERFVACAPSQDERVDPAAGFDDGYTPDEAHEEARRCMHCDCRKSGSCQLQDAADIVGANPKLHRGIRPTFIQYESHPRLVFEPGKCIKAGHCIRIAAEANEELGFAFIGRGYNVKVGVPFEMPLTDAIKDVVGEVIAACPTGALAYRDDVLARFNFLDQNGKSITSTSNAPQGEQTRCD